MRHQMSGYGFINTGYAKSFTDFKSSVPVVVSSTNREDNGQRLGEGGYKFKHISNNIFSKLIEYKYG